MDNKVKYALAAAFWIAAWQVLAWVVGNQILLAGPVDVIATLARDCTTSAFWLAIGFSLARIASGFAIAFTLAIVASIVAWRLSAFEALLAPLVTFVKSVPVVCIIVLLLVWTGAANVSVVAVALMVFPPVYFSTLEGLKQTSEDMRQMLDVFAVSPLGRLRYYYLPAVMPYIVSAAKVVVGIAWKSGVAAEVIGIPGGSVGAGIYSAKIGLDTARLFSWTAAVVGLSALSEKLFLGMLSAITKRGATVKAASRSAGSPAQPAAILFRDVRFDYGDDVVINGFTHIFEQGGRYCLMAPSGAGKSTLLNLACGLLTPSDGTLERPERVSRSFQDDRLLAQLSAWDNILLVSGSLSQADRDLLKFDLDEMLGFDSAKLAIGECSGGMKRKVALVRALAADGAALLLDEPFAGLDEDSRTDAIAFINRHLRKRTLIVATHDHDDVAFLNAELVRLSNHQQERV